MCVRRHDRHMSFFIGWRALTGEEEVDAGEVVGEGVEPDVEDVAGLAAGGHGDAPVEGGAGDGEVQQALFEPRWGLAVGGREGTG